MSNAVYFCMKPDIFFCVGVMHSGEYDVCDVTLSVYPHRASLKNMPGHGGNRTYDLWNTSPMLCQLSYVVRSVQVSDNSELSLVPSISMVSSNITQSNITNMKIFITWQTCRSDATRGRCGRGNSHNQNVDHEKVGHMSMSRLQNTQI